ncbi:UNVERIFIED_CONTAM: Thioredoxin-like protein 4B [Sesamum latifolium]|uniref:Thioredoxin-like protein 4B n=1 Tax=Sesamum latifolium TaxID=2727402 RepID=A0AAW2XZL4_9LAMI
MEYLLPTLREKREGDSLIRDTLDKVLVLRFGRSSDAVCLQRRHIVVSRSLCFFSFFPFVRNRRSGVDFLQVLVELIWFLTWLFIDRQLYKSARDVSRFATVALVDVDAEEIQVYVEYFAYITFIPSTVFLLSMGHHMKMDSGYLYSILFSVRLNLDTFLVFIRELCSCDSNT